mgnify:FL=1
MHSEELERLLRVRLSAEQRADLEARAEDDPFAAEALEGYRSMDDPSRAMGRATSASARIAEELGLRKGSGRHIPIRRWLAVAAVLLLLAGTVVLTSRLVRTDEGSVAMETTPAEEVPPTPPSTTIDQADADGVEDAVGAAPEQDERIDDVEEPAVDAVEQTIEPDALQESGDQPPAEDVEPTLPDRRFEEVELASDQSNEVIEPSYNAVGGAMEDEEFAQETAPVPVEEEAPAPADLSESPAARTMTAPTTVSPASGESRSDASGFNVGLSAYKAGQYDEAIPAFERSVRNGRLVPESNYYIGMSHFFSGRHTQAIQAFDRVIAADDNNTSNARWYKAESLIRLERTDEAIGQLQLLVDEGGLYAEEARRKIESLTTD